MQTVLMILIPFIGTTLGSAMVFFFKGEKLNPKIEKILLGFASGIMVAVSFFSLLLPALEMTPEGPFSFGPAVIGFLVGMLFLLLLDELLPHLHLHSDKPEGIKPKRKVDRTLMIVLAMVLHNIPEGASAGIALVSSSTSEVMTQGTALALLLGIAIQNFPEGAVVALPLKAQGKSKMKAFILGSLFRYR